MKEIPAAYERYVQFAPVSARVEQGSFKGVRRVLSEVNVALSLYCASEGARELCVDAGIVLAMSQDRVALGPLQPSCALALSEPWANLSHYITFHRTRHPRRPPPHTPPAAHDTTAETARIDRRRRMTTYWTTAP